MPDDPTPRQPRRPGVLIVVGAAALTTLSSIAVAGVAFADRGGNWSYRGGGRHWWGVGSVLLGVAAIAASAAIAATFVARRNSLRATTIPVGAVSEGPSAGSAPNAVDASIRSESRTTR